MIDGNSTAEGDECVSEACESCKGMNRSNRVSLHCCPTQPVSHAARPPDLRPLVAEADWKQIASDGVVQSHTHMRTRAGLAPPPRPLLMLPGSCEPPTMRADCHGGFQR